MRHLPLFNSVPETGNNSSAMSSDLMSSSRKSAGANGISNEILKYGEHRLAIKISERILQIFKISED
jgi:hypothetical protein